MIPCQIDHSKKRYNLSLTHYLLAYLGGQPRPKHIDPKFRNKLITLSEISRQVIKLSCIFKTIQFCSLKSYVRESRTLKKIEQKA